MSRILGVVFAATFCMSCAASGTGSSPVDTAPVSAGTAAAAEPDGANSASAETRKTKTICRHVETTGSRLGGKRVCRTREQWDELARQNREDVGKLQRGGPASSN